MIISDRYLNVFKMISVISVLRKCAKVRRKVEEFQAKCLYFALKLRNICVFFINETRLISIVINVVVEGNGRRCVQTCDLFDPLFL